MSVYVVTGGAGFIGSHIVEALVKKGETVRVFDNFSTGKTANTELFGDKITVIKGDVRDLEALMEAFAGAEYVFHLAAQVSAPGSVADPITNDDINVRGTLCVLKCAKEAGVKRVIFTSSCAVYGDTEAIPIVETTPKAPTSPYAASKLAGEIYAQMFTKLYGLDTVCLRYFNVYGPRQDPKSQYAAAIPIFIQLIKQDKQPTIYGDGEQTRDFVYVGDVARANLLACKSDTAVGGVFNIGGGSRISINNLLNGLGKIADKDVHPIYVQERAGDIKHSGSNIDLAAKALGFEPSMPLEEGLRKTFEWFSDNS